MDVYSLCLQIFIIFGVFKDTNNSAVNVNYHLVFNPTPMSWIGAATWCQIKDGDLVTVSSYSVVQMINWYKSNEWSTQWTNNVWSGLYTYNNVSGYWQGTCDSLDYAYWEAAQVYNPGAPCVYMRSTDLHWFYSDCSKKYNVICQIPIGNCTFGDQNMEVDKSFNPLPEVVANTLSDCKTVCDKYLNGNEQCWALQYQASSSKCYLYVSVNPAQYLSTRVNTNKNVFYSTRNCFSASIIKESEPATSSNISSMINECFPPTTTSSNEATKLGQTTSTLKTTYLQQATTIPETTTHNSDSKTTEYLVTTTESSSQATESQSNTTESSSQATELQSNTTESSSQATELQSNTTESSSQATELQSNTTESPTQATESNLTTTESSSQATETEPKTTGSSSQSTKADSVFSDTSTNAPTTFYYCDFKCPCDFKSDNITSQMLQGRVEELRRILQIDKKDTNAYLRTLTSAPDSRKSSQAIGAFGALFIVFSVFAIVGMDISKLLKHIRCKHLKRRKFAKRRDHTIYLNK